MMITGTVLNGAVVPDAGSHLPEGARVMVELLDEDDFEMPDAEELAKLPPDHPMAPYNREVEVAIILESVRSVENGEVCIPFREAMAKLSAKYGLGPLPSE